MAAILYQSRDSNTSLPGERVRTSGNSLNYNFDKGLSSVGP